VNDHPALSVIIPVYNRRDLIQRAIRSLLDQDYTEPYEIVVVDDGSSDGSAEAADKIDDRVRVVRQTNQGAAVARHRGVAEARAEIVAFHDSDDIALPNKLSSLVAALKAHPDAVCGFSFARNSLTGKVVPPPSFLSSVGVSFDGNKNGIGIVWNPLEIQLRRGSPIVLAMNFATYRSIAIQASRDRSFFAAANDYDLLLRIARHGPFNCDPVISCDFEFQNDGISHGNQGITSAYALCAAHGAYLQSNHTPELRSAIRDLVETQAIKAGIRLLFRRRWALFWRVLMITCLHHRLRKVPKRLYRAVDSCAKHDAGLFPGWIRFFFVRGSS